MGDIYHVDQLTFPGNGLRYVALDTNVLIQACDHTNPFHETTRRMLQKCRRQGSAKFVYFLATKLELKEYLRKRALTLFLREQFADTEVLFGGSGEADVYCCNHPKLGASEGGEEDLSDREIKAIRQRCFENFSTVETGMKRWQQFCQMATRQFMNKADELLRDLGIEYASLQSKELFPENGSLPRWQDQERYILEFGMSSSDAAILNMAQTTDRIHGIVTNDSDMIEIFRAEREQFTGAICCYTFMRRFLKQVS